MTNGEQVKGINQIRIPRLGKIRLGIKEEKRRSDGTTVSYPRATDFFVCPPEVEEVYGEKPIQLRIAFPVENERIFARQSYSMYSRTRGLLCRGNGVEAMRLLDTATGALPTEASKAVEMRPWPCHPKHEEGEESQELCSEYTGEGYKAPQCRLLMQLQVLLPDVPGLGVWQIDTGSFNNIVALNSCLALLRSLTGGRVSMIPLLLTLGPEERQVEGRKKKVNLLHFTVPLSFAALEKALAMKPLAALLPPPEVPEVDIETINEQFFPELLTPEERRARARQDIDDLWPEDAPRPAPVRLADSDTSFGEPEPPSENGPESPADAPQDSPQTPTPVESHSGASEGKTDMTPQTEDGEAEAALLRQKIQEAVEKRWPGQDKNWGVFYRQWGVGTVWELADDVLVAVLKAAMPPQRPKGV